MAFYSQKAFRRKFSGPISISAGIGMWLRRILIVSILVITVGSVALESERAKLEAWLYPKVMDVMATLLSEVSDISNKTIATWREWKSYFSLREENARLKNEVEQLSIYFAAYELLKSENASLQALVNYHADPSLKFTTVRVVGDITGPFSHTILVNAGLDQGIRKGQAVMNHQGLIGRVIDTGKSSSRILLISDTHSRIPVITASSHERGMVSGNNSNRLSMLYLADGSKVEKGELVFSSGDGDLLPPGILVGAIVETHGNEVVVEPAAQFNQLEFVKVISY